MEKNYKKVGTIDLVSNKDKSAGLTLVMVSDPCYDNISNFSHILEVESGNYNCFIGVEDCGKWGNRVSRMAILKDNFTIDFLDKYGDFENSVAVDSGTMSISDSHYYDLYHTASNDDDVREKNDKWYDKNVCEWAMGKNFHIAEGFSFIASSGYGDGLYDVYSFSHNGAIVGVEIVFIDENNDDSWCD